MRWNRQSVTWVALAFALVAFVSLMLALDGRSFSFDVGGDDSPPAAAQSGTEIQTGDVDEESGLRWVLEDDLPPLAQGTLALIDQGGPFPFDRDGITFENREGLLPDEPRGYYREYTVASPDADSRGPLRIVAGEGDEWYWTEDHYDSFERILRRSG